MAKRPTGRKKKKAAQRPETTNTVVAERPVRPRRTREEVTRALKADLLTEAELIESAQLQIAAARRRRDALLVKLCDRGVSERELGRIAKMTGPRVNQIYHGTYSNNGR